MVRARKFSTVLGTVLHVSKDQVRSGLLYSLSVKTHHDAAEGLVAVLNVKVDLVRNDRALGGARGRREEQRDRHKERGQQRDEGEARHGEVDKVDLTGIVL